MIQDGTMPSEREQRLNQVLAEYLEAAGAGQEPDRARLLADHPDLASEVAQFLDNQDRMKALVAPAGTIAVQVTSATGPVEPAGSENAADSSSIFGNYELLGEIARGGMGVVYKARHRQLKRVVALKKILGADARSSASVRRFRLEAEAAAQLDHPNIVPIYEVGDVDGQPFFTMKLIDGGGLDRQIGRFVKDPRAAARVVAIVARAVHHAHQRGILHRDLKPGNILLASGGREPPEQNIHSHGASSGGSRPPLADGTPLVTDFGLAKWLTNPSETSAKPDLTRTGMVVGTASYMAPEQAQNQPLTTSADVYALGVILFELLTGRTPFLGRTVLDILLQVVEKEAPRPRSLNPRVDPDLELICLKCLEKDPAQRFGSAAALAEELENWSAGEAISIRPPGRLTRVRRWCRRNPLPALLWAGLLLCLTVVVVGSPVAVFLIDAERRNSDSIAAKLEVQNDTLASTNEQLNTALGNLKTSLTNESTARSETALEREKLRRQLVRRYVGDGSRLLDDGDTLGALVWFAGALALDQGDPEREALHRLRVGMVLQRSPRLLQAWFVDKPLLDATFSSDGQRVCGVGQDGVARTWTVGKEKATFQFGEAMRKAAFTRDGNRLLAVHGDGKARLWDTATGKVVHEFAHDAVNAATLSVNEAWVVTAGQDGTARAWELANLKRAPRQTPRGSALHYAAVGPHGRVIIASGENETVWWHWHDRAKGRPAGFEALKKMPANVESATFGLDDSLVLTLHHSLPNRPHLWSVSAQSVERKPAPERLLRGEPELCFGPRKGLLLTVEGAAAQAWDSADGKLVGPRFPHAGDVTHAVFSPDGKRVFTACTDRTARVWDAQTGEPLTPAMTRPAGVIARASFSMEGRRLLLASNQQAGPNTIEVLEIAAPETAYHKPEGPWGPHTVFSVDGRLALTSSSDQTTVQMWEVAPKNSQMIGASPRLTTPATLAIFSPENKHVLVSDRTTLHVGHIGDAASGKTLKWLTIQASGELRQAAVTGDGTRVVALSRHENQSLLETWDAATGKAVGTAFKQPRPEARLEKLSPDGRLLVLARPLVAQLNLLDVATRKVLPVSPLVHSVRVNAAAFSPDARQLVTACVDRTAQVWDTVKGEPVAALVPLQSAILGFTFRGDGRMLATIHARDGGGDREGGAVRVWDTATWQPLTPLLAHDRVVRVAFGPDGRSIITSAADDNVRVWDLRAATGTPGDLVEQANLMAGRRLHENGYLVPLEEGSLRKVWPALRKHLTQ